MRLRVHEQAEIELQSAVRYYEDRQEGLGHDFYQRIAECMQAICGDPLQFARYEALRSKFEFRRAIVERFPYVIVYQLLNDEVLILAIAHSSRRPGYWSRRRQSGD
jgi:plasmid stabilization system protein ParE